MQLIRRKGDGLTATLGRLNDRFARVQDQRHARLDKWGSRLSPALTRLLGDASRQTTQGQSRLLQLDERLQAAPMVRLSALSQRLDALDRMRLTLGYKETLTRGYAVVRGDGRVVTSKTTAGAAQSVEIEFADGKLVVQQPKQGSLF